MLVHGGYKYVQNGLSKVTYDGITTRWRCGHSINGRFGCTAKACTLNKNGVERVTFNGYHCHRAKSEF